MHKFTEDSFRFGFIESFHFDKNRMNEYELILFNILAAT